MFDFKTPRSDVSAAIESIRPCLSSPRLVRLFMAIGMLAVTRPSAIETIEIVVERMARARPLKAAAPIVTSQRGRLRGKR